MSVQIVWPYFKTASETLTHASAVPDDDPWRLAIFDALAANGDRNDFNWGYIAGLDRPKLIDHGHAFETHAGSVSPFTDRCRGREIPVEYMNRLQQFVGASDRSRLRQVLASDIVDRIVDRGQTFVQVGELAV